MQPSLAPFEIDFQWPVDEVGYRVVDVPAHQGRALLDVIRGGLTLQPRSGRHRVANPLSINRHLYVIFARIDPESPAQIERFATAFGLLSNKDEGAREYIEDWRKHITGMAGLLAAQEQGRLNEHLGSFAEAFVTGANAVLRTSFGAAPPQLVLRPRTLIGAIRLQFVQDLVLGRQVRSCLCCGTPFHVGGDSGLRPKAKFCSDSCRIKFNNRPDVRAAAQRRAAKSAVTKARKPARRIKR